MRKILLFSLLCSSQAWAGATPPAAKTAKPSDACKTDADCEGASPKQNCTSGKCKTEAPPQPPKQPPPPT